MDFVTTRDLRVMAEGQRKGEIELLSRQLNIKLSHTLTYDLENRIQALSEDNLMQLGEALFNFSTVSDLTNWLDQH